MFSPDVILCGWPGSKANQLKLLTTVFFQHKMVLSIGLLRVLVICRLVFDSNMTFTVDWTLVTKNQSISLAADVNAGGCSVNDPCTAGRGLCYDGGNGTACTCFDGYYGRQCQHEMGEARFAAVGSFLSSTVISSRTCIIHTAHIVQQRWSNNFGSLLLK